MSIENLSLSNPQVRNREIHLTAKFTASTYRMEDRGTPIVAPPPAAKPAAPETAGSLPADSATFGFTLWTVVVILGLLMFMPVAVLGPIAEHLALGR